MDTNTEIDHKKWMKLALAQAQDALLAGEFPVGCVLVASGKVVGQGRRLYSSTLSNELDHAEILAIRDWISQGRQGEDIWAYVTLEPCLMCFGALIINGIHRICFAYEDVMGGATGLSFNRSNSKGPPTELMMGNIRDLYSSASIELVPWVMRQESLALFKKFFSDSKAEYLADTFLARYTLDTK